ncbi:unnamed protein product [Amoebophrya sp. A120]|nr:unnamed protein product [Amoebophrya sp. A120]|eukprot:GSA120T00020743001.1
MFAPLFSSPEKKKKKRNSTNAGGSAALSENKSSAKRRVSSTTKVVTFHDGEDEILTGAADPRGKSSARKQDRLVSPEKQVVEPSSRTTSVSPSKVGLTLEFTSEDHSPAKNGSVLQNLSNKNAASTASHTGSSGSTSSLAPPPLWSNKIAQAHRYMTASRTTGSADLQAETHTTRTLSSEDTTKRPHGGDETRSRNSKFRQHFDVQQEALALIKSLDEEDDDHVMADAGGPRSSYQSHGFGGGATASTGGLHIVEGVHRSPKASTRDESSREGGARGAGALAGLAQQGAVDRDDPSLGGKEKIKRQQSTDRMLRQAEGKRFMKNNRKSGGVVEVGASYTGGDLSIGRKAVALEDPSLLQSEESIELTRLPGEDEEETAEEDQNVLQSHDNSPSDLSDKSAQKLSRWRRFRKYFEQVKVPGNEGEDDDEKLPGDDDFQQALQVLQDYSPREYFESRKRKLQSDATWTKYSHVILISVILFCNLLYIGVDVDSDRPRAPSTVLVAAGSEDENEEDATSTTATSGAENGAASSSRIRILVESFEAYDDLDQEVFENSGLARLHSGMFPLSSGIRKLFGLPESSLPMLGQSQCRSAGPQLDTDLQTASGSCAEPQDHRGDDDTRLGIAQPASGADEKPTALLHDDVEQPAPGATKMPSNPSASKRTRNSARRGLASVQPPSLSMSRLRDRFFQKRRGEAYDYLLEKKRRLEAKKQKQRQLIAARAGTTDHLPPAASTFEVVQEVYEPRVIAKFLKKLTGMQTLDTRDHSLWNRADFYRRSLYTPHEFPLLYSEGLSATAPTTELQQRRMENGSVVNRTVTVLTTKEQWSRKLEEVEKMNGIGVASSLPAEPVLPLGPPGAEVHAAAVEDEVDDGSTYFANENLQFLYENFHAACDAVRHKLNPAPRLFLLSAAQSRLLFEQEVMRYDEKAYDMKHRRNTAGHEVSVQTVQTIVNAKKTHTRGRRLKVLVSTSASSGARSPPRTDDDVLSATPRRRILLELDDRPPMMWVCDFFFYLFFLAELIFRLTRQHNYFNLEHFLYDNYLPFITIILDTTRLIFLFQVSPKDNQPTPDKVIHTMMLIRVLRLWKYTQAALSESPRFRRFGFVLDRFYQLRRPLLFGSILFVMACYFMSFLITSQVKQSVMDGDYFAYMAKINPSFSILDYFSATFYSFFTIAQMTSFDRWLTGIIRPMGEVQFTLAILLMLVVVIIQFGLVNNITGLFVAYVIKSGEEQRDQNRFVREARRQARLKLKAMTRMRELIDAVSVPAVEVCRKEGKYFSFRPVLPADFNQDALKQEGGGQTIEDVTRTIVNPNTGEEETVVVKNYGQRMLLQREDLEHVIHYVEPPVPSSQLQTVTRASFLSFRNRGKGQEQMPEPPEPKMSWKEAQKAIGLRTDEVLDCYDCLLEADTNCHGFGVTTDAFMGALLSYAGVLSARDLFSIGCTMRKATPKIINIEESCNLAITQCEFIAIATERIHALLFELYQAKGAPPPGTMKRVTSHNKTRPNYPRPYPPVLEPPRGVLSVGVRVKDAEEAANRRKRQMEEEEEAMKLGKTTWHFGMPVGHSRDHLPGSFSPRFRRIQRRLKRLLD